MKLQLNVTNKTITFEKNIKYREFQKAINILIDNTAAIEEYSLMIGTVPIDNITTIKTPATYTWDVKKNYAWLEYQGTSNINTCCDDDKKEQYATLKDGVYNIEIV